MLTKGKTVKPSLRETLADSHISAVAIALLLLWALGGIFRALWGPLPRVADFLFTAVAILDIPYFSTKLSFADRIDLITGFAYFVEAGSSLAAAWCLSRWVYGVGPLHSLSKYRTALARRNNV